jgi:hypothetical protein
LLHRGHQGPVRDLTNFSTTAAESLHR